MGYIKKLKNNELVGGTDKTTIYPVTSTKAVFEEVTEGDKSSFKSQETINGDYDDRIKDLETVMPDTVKSITINGGQRINTVDENGNVDLTIYSDGGQDYEGLTEVVADLRDIVGENPEEPQSGTLLERVDTLEDAVGTGGSVDQRISNGITTALDSLDAEYSDDGESYIDFRLKQADGKIDDFEIEDSKLQNAITSLTNAIGGGNITLVGSLPTAGDAGKIYRVVNNNNTYIDYMYVAGESTPWKPLAVHDLSTIQPQIAYYTCTASGSGALETKVFVSNGSLTYSTANGGHIKIKMGEANTHAAPVYLKFNTEDSTSKQVYYNGEPVSASNTWEANEVISVYFDGTKYMASNSQGGGGKAEKIKYNNSQSGLTADNVQGALDEVIGNIDDIFQDNIESDFDISDEQGYAIVRFINGEIRTKYFDSSAVPTLDTSVSDFAISDINGWDIVQFSGGHIKTKYFDSQLFVNTTKKFIGKKFAILGDSISTFQGWLPSDIAGYDGSTYATYYSSGDVNSVTKTWWYQMLEILGISPSFDVVNNCSWSGSQVTGDADSTTNAYAGCSDRRISDLSIRGYVPDIVIVFISCNDWHRSVPVGNWDVNTALPTVGNTLRSAYAIMLNKINLSYPNARIFCCTNLDDVARDKTAGYPPDTNGVTTYSWNKNIIEIAEAFGCDVINMHDCGIKYSNVASLAVDTGLHPNAAGMKMMAQKAASELIAKY